MNQHQAVNGSISSTGKLVSKVVLLLAFVAALNYAGHCLTEYLDQEIWPHSPQYLDQIIIVMMLIFFVFMTLPFLPAIEISLVLLALVEIKGVLVIYGLTILALSLAYGMGHRMPLHVLVRILYFFHLTKAAAVFARIAEADPASRLEMLQQEINSSMAQRWVRHRYLLLALLLNMPGNAVIGGGGGIAMLCGMSGLVSYPKFLLTTLLAALPIPMLVIAQKLMLVSL